MKYLLLCIAFLPFSSYATIQIEPTEKQAIAQKAAFIAYHSGVDENIVVPIFECESGLKQVRSYRRNPNGTYDWGVGQINDVNIPFAKRLGMDVKNNVEDNIRFAVQHLIKKDGAYRHYKSSASCWLPKVALHATPVKDV